MFKNSSLYLNNKQYFRCVLSDVVTIEDKPYLGLRYELSKRAPQDVKEQYIHYCEEHDKTPSFYSPSLIEIIRQSILGKRKTHH